MENSALWLTHVLLRPDTDRGTINHLPLDKMAAILQDDIFKCIFLKENVRISIKIPLKFVPKGPINNFAALVQIMAWRRPMMVKSPMHIGIIRPQWV